MVKSMTIYVTPNCKSSYLQFGFHLCPFILCPFIPGTVGTPNQLDRWEPRGHVRFGTSCSFATASIAACERQRSVRHRKRFPQLGRIDSELLCVALS